MPSLRDTMSERLKSSDFNKLYPGGVPGIGAIQSRIENLSQEELTNRIAASIAQLDREKLLGFGQRIADYGAQHGIDVPQEVRSGDLAPLGNRWLEPPKRKGYRGNAEVSAVGARGRRS
ncbi:MAG: hypothetical protein R2839_05025 [Thermomicrobiales bacterium]